MPAGAPDDRLSMMERMRQWVEDCPRAGAPFPETPLALLDGDAVDPASLRGRAVVLETGSYT